MSYIDAEVPGLVPQPGPPQEFTVQLAGGRQEPDRPNQHPRHYTISDAGILAITEEAPEATTITTYSPIAWESVQEVLAARTSSLTKT